MLLKVNFFDMKLVTVQSNPSTQKLQLFTKVFLPLEKLFFIGALNFYTKVVDKLHINLLTFYDLFNETTPWNWTDDHERLFLKLKTSLTLLKQNLPFQTQNIPFYYSRRFALKIGLGALLFQLKERNKMKVIYYNSRILNPQEHKFSTLDRKLLGIVHALQIYEFIIIGSPHPIHIFTDHKLLLHCFPKKEILVHDYIELKYN